MTPDDLHSSSDEPRPVIPYHSRQPSQPPVDDVSLSALGESRRAWGMQLLCIGVAVAVFLLIWLTSRLAVV